MSTYTAQNIGAGNNQRVKEGHRADLKIGFAISIVFFVACFFKGDMLIELFIKDGSPLAMATGIKFLKIVAPFYMMIVMKLVTDGILRGSGAVGPFMVATFSDLILRVVLAYLFSSPFGATGIWMSWPIGWAMGTALSVGYYAKGVWKAK